MFLGYSILQLLEYLVTAVVTRLEKFHEVLSKQTADCKHERNSKSQSKDKTQDTVSFEKNDCHGLGQLAEVPFSINRYNASKKYFCKCLCMEQNSVLGAL